MSKTVVALVAAFACFATGIAGGAELKVRIPTDPNIETTADSYSPYRLQSRDWGTATRQEKIRVTDKGNGELVVHRRVDNGTAGSGRVYRLHVTSAAVPNGTELTFVTTQEPPQEYREGLFGRFPVPAFSDEDLVQFLASGTVAYKLELDAEFPVDAIAANFERLAKGRTTRSGQHVGAVVIDGAPVEFSYDVMPYRNGSKAVIRAQLTPAAAGAGAVDFAPLIEALKQALSNVVNA